MVAAIMNGTLEPGERLNDDELVKWLGVSRTPIREAIARLSGWGLVEMEPNRYTRVAEVDAVVYGQAVQLLEGLHTLALEWPKDALTAADLKAFIKEAKAISTALGKKDLAAVTKLSDLYGRIVATTGNTLLIDMELPLRMRVTFLTPKTADGIDWDHFENAAEQITTALN
jgi:DNA-binding GntR family transcriptional regulator